MHITLFINNSNVGNDGAEEGIRSVIILPFKRALSCVRYQEPSHLYFNFMNSNEFFRMCVCV